MRFIGDVRVTYGIAQTRCFQRQVKTIGAKRVERGHVKVLENIEHYQRREPLRIRRNLNDVQTAIVGRNRIDLVATVAEKILRRKERAARVERLRHVVGDVAFIEGPSPLAGDGLQGRCQRRKADDIALFGRSTVKQIVLCGAGIGLELADVALPVPRYAGGDWETVLRIFDRGRQSSIEAEAAMCF